MATISFFRQSPLHHEFTILTELGKPGRGTHARIAEATGLSIGMVNRYIASLSRKGLVRRIGDANRNVRYVLTSEGQHTKDYLLVDLNKELISAYRLAREEITRRLRVVSAGKPARVAVCPAGDTAEVAIGACLTLPGVSITAVLDDAPEKWGTGFFGCVVHPFSELKTMRLDGVLIATVEFAEVIEQRVRENGDPQVPIWRLF